MLSMRLPAAALIIALMASAFAATGASAQGAKVELCHNGHTISVSVNAEAAHLAIGDTPGACNAAAPLVFSGASTSTTTCTSLSWSLSGFVSGGTTPYTFTLASGTPPPGWGFSASGVISGSPYSGGTYTFVVTVTDSGAPAQTATATFTITVTGPTCYI